MPRPRPKKDGETQLPRGVFLRQGTYWIEYHHNGKRHREKVGKSLKVAQALYIKRKEDLRIGKKLGLNIKPLTLADLIDEHLPILVARKRQPREDLRYAAFWKEELGDFIAEELEAKEVELVKARLLTEGRKPATVNRYLAHLRTVLNTAYRREQIRRNPLASVAQLPEHNVRKRILRAEEETKLLAVFDQDGQDLIELALETGAREQNIFGMTWSGVHLDRDQVEVIQKGGSLHTIFLTPRAKQILQRREKEKRSEAWVFPNLGGTNHIDAHNWYNRVWLPAVKEAGIEDLRFHDLRHTFVSRALENGLDAKTVQVMVGHKTMQMTTQRYASLSVDHLKAAAKRATKKPKK